MGYLCPVCEEPFADSSQCANHLAVTAILHGGDHETWLAETVETALQQDDSADDSPTAPVDGWESVPREELAALVAEHATETPDDDQPGDHAGQPRSVDRPTGHHEQTASPVDGPASQPPPTDPTAAVDGLDADAREILREARELTERMGRRGSEENEDA